MFGLGMVVKPLKVVFGLLRRFWWQVLAFLGSLSIWQMSREYTLRSVNNGAGKTPAAEVSTVAEAVKVGQTWWGILFAFIALAIGSVVIVAYVKDRQDTERKAADALARRMPAPKPGWSDNSVYFCIGLVFAVNGALYLVAYTLWNWLMGDAVIFFTVNLLAVLLAFLGTKTTTKGGKQVPDQTYRYGAVAVLVLIGLALVSRVFNSAEEVVVKSRSIASQNAGRLSDLLLSQGASRNLEKTVTAPVKGADDSWSEVVKVEAGYGFSGTAVKKYRVRFNGETVQIYDPNKEKCYTADSEEKETACYSDRVATLEYQAYGDKPVEITIKFFLAR